MKQLRLRSLPVFVVLLLPVALLAQGMKPIKFEEYDLKNGLHVILYPEHSAPTVAVRVYYHVGSKDEDPTRTGFAHFFEHLMFEATNEIPREQYSRNIEEVGGNLNAYTSLDQTVYIDNIPSNYLKMALWAESERMHWLKVDTIGVETQRQVVKEERRNRYENQPYGSFFLKLMHTVFPTSQYSWTPIGDAQYIDQATIEEFRDFYRKYYVPNNAVLVVAGDFDSKQAREWIGDYFGDVPAGAAVVRKPFHEPEQTAERTAEVVEKHTPLPGIIYAWRSVPESHKDSYAFDLLTKVLSEGNSSRFINRLVDKDQLALQVSAIPLTLESAGVFGVLAIAKAGVESEKIRKALDEEIARIQNEPISEEEFRKIRNTIEKDHIEEAASNENIAIKLGHMYTMFRETNRVNTELSRYLAVTREDIQRVAREYLTPARRSVITYPVAATQ